LKPLALASCSVVPGATEPFAVEPLLSPVNASVPPAIASVPLQVLAPLKVSIPTPVLEKPDPVTDAEMAGEQLVATLMAGALVSVRE